MNEKPLSPAVPVAPQAQVEALIQRWREDAKACDAQENLAESLGRSTTADVFGARARANRLHAEELEEVLAALPGDRGAQQVIHQIGVMAMTACSDPHSSAEVYRQALTDICNFALKGQREDVVCAHGTAMDVHCCNCHSGFIFDPKHECPTPEQAGDRGAWQPDEKWDAFEHALEFESSTQWWSTYRAARAAIEQQVRDLRAEVARLDALINNPHTEDFLSAVQLEAAHQRERWAASDDAGKTDADWFWLIGYLAGKALNKPEKRLHHIITTAAAALNWHRHRAGFDTDMRPGIAEPTEKAHD